MAVDPFDEIETIKSAKREEELKKQQQESAIRQQEAHLMHLRRLAEEKYDTEQDDLKTRYGAIIERVLDEFGMKVWGTKVIKETVAEEVPVFFWMKREIDTVQEIKNYYLERAGVSISKNDGSELCRGECWQLYNNKDEDNRYFIWLQEEIKTHTLPEAGDIRAYHFTGFCIVGIYKRTECEYYVLKHAINDILVPVDPMEIKKALVRLFSEQISSTRKYG